MEQWLEERLEQWGTTGGGMEQWVEQWLKQWVQWRTKTGTKRTIEQ